MLSISTRESLNINKFNNIINNARRIHGNKYDYRFNNPEVVTTTRSRINIYCNTCGNFWDTRVSHHIHDKSGCGKCAIKIVGKAKAWNLQKLLIAAVIHNNNFDYSEVKDEHITDRFSKIPLTCNTCYSPWRPTINDHISHKTGCPYCAGNAPITLESFLEKAEEIHGDLYDYSQVQEEHIHGNKSIIPVLCIKCNKIWWPDINNHINHRNGCSNCRHSKGELLCEDTLEFLGLLYQCQVQIPLLPLKRYDFFFTFQNRNYLLEFDGQQHFRYNDFFHRDEEKFEESQQRDILKTNIALQSGYCVIRIDYTQIDNIEYHIRNAISNNYWLYVTDTIMYQYILDNIQLSASAF